MCGTDDLTNVGGTSKKTSPGTLCLQSASTAHSQQKILGAALTVLTPTDTYVTSPRANSRNFHHRPSPSLCVNFSPRIQALLSCSQPLALAAAD